MRVPLLAAAVIVTSAFAMACSSSDPGPGSRGGSSSGDQMTTSGGVDFPPTGNMYVDTRRCPACHQSTTPQADGFMSGARQPIMAPNFPASVVLYGPNLTPDMMTGIGAWTDDQITTAIRNGVDNQGERLCPEMQHFPDMADDELNSILGYLHSLKPVSNQVPVSHCPPLKP